MNCRRLLSQSALTIEFVQRNHLISPILAQVLQFCSIHTYLQPKHKSNMKKAYICYDNGNDVFDFSFHLMDIEKKIDRQFNFTRQITEKISVFLGRIETNVTKIISKKNKKTKMQPEVSNASDDVNKVKLHKGQLEVDNDLTCESFLKDPEEHQFIILGQTYLVKLNAPIVSCITLPTSIMVGFPTYPSKFKSLYTDKKLSKFYWLRNNLLDKKPDWSQEVGQGYMYTPTVSDVGCNLRLFCIPSNSSMNYGKIVEVTSENVVEAGPGQCPFEIRQEFTKHKLSGKSFRILTYNILADTYADTDYSKEIFWYCPPYALDMSYRKQLILKEIIGFNSDIICLQEVDSSMYENDLLPCLSTLNYDGVFVKKGKTNEGTATFFNKDRLEKLEFVSAVMNEKLDIPEFDAVWSKIENEKMKERFLNRNTTLQVITLRSRENPREIFIVGNTHLYFRPDSDNIRLLQGYYAITYVQEVVTRAKAQNPGCNVSVLFCGDFNSSPDCGVYQLFTENYIPENYKDWRSETEEIIENISLTQKLRMSSACGTPEYTNYTVGFSSCLDYIYYERDKFVVEQVIPLPSQEDVTLHMGLPSVIFPSDHISLCADLKLLDSIDESS